MGSRQTECLSRQGGAQRGFRRVRKGRLGIPSDLAGAAPTESGMKAISRRMGWGLLLGPATLTVASCITSAALAQDASVTADLSALRAKYGNALTGRVANEFMPMRRKVLAQALNKDPRGGDCGQKPDFKVTRIVPVHVPEVPHDPRHWTERVELSCGGSVARNFIVGLTPVGDPVPGILAPGDTLADFRTQGSLFPQLVAAAGAATAAEKRGCPRATILDTQVTNLPSPGVEPRRWSEDWLFDVCGEAFGVSVQFTQPKGHTAGFVFAIKPPPRKSP